MDASGASGYRDRFAAPPSALELNATLALHNSSLNMPERCYFDIKEQCMTNSRWAMKEVIINNNKYTKYTHSSFIARENGGNGH